MRQGAIEQQPSDPRAASRLSMMAQRRGNLASDLSLVEKAINGNASAPHLPIEHGTILQRQGRLEEALAAYDQAVSLKPDYAEAHAGRGAVLLRQKRLEEALGAFDQALCHAPDAPELHFHRGLALHRQGRLEEALRAYDRAVVQEWDLSCGAAALATLLNYQHGDPVSEREIAKGLIEREEYVENPLLVRVRHGFSLLDLKRYVDDRGYRGIGYGQLTLEDLIEQAPIMVPIRTKGYNHFVVFRGALGNRVLLADPAFGNHTMLAAKFEKVWLEYPKFGKVGFVVARADAVAPRTNSPRCQAISCSCDEYRWARCSRLSRCYPAGDRSAVIASKRRST